MTHALEGDREVESAAGRQARPLGHDSRALLTGRYSDGSFVGMRGEELDQPDGDSGSGAARAAGETGTMRWKSPFRPEW